MPGVTFSGARPESRPGAEAQVGIVPGFHLSDAPQRDDNPGVGMLQAAGWVDLGSLIEPVDGLAVGARFVEELMEPMVRYRFWLDSDHRFSFGVVGFLTFAEGSEEGADVAYWHGGVEASTDIRLTPVNRWAELHLQLGLNLTGLRADGHYCRDREGFAVDCTEESVRVGADLTGTYPTAFLGLSVDLFRDVPVLHVLRVSTMIAGGSMPRIRDEKQASDRGWFSWGLNLEVGLGAW